MWLLKTDRSNYTFFFFLFWGTGVWTQSLHLEPLHQPFFGDGFFPTEGLWTIYLGWLHAVIFLIFASWVAGITAVSTSTKLGVIILISDLKRLQK
jgi:hypothetical protein